MHLLDRDSPGKGAVPGHEEHHTEVDWEGPELEHDTQSVDGLLPGSGPAGGPGVHLIRRILT